MLSLNKKLIITTSLVVVAFLVLTSANAKRAGAIDGLKAESYMLLKILCKDKEHFKTELSKIQLPKDDTGIVVMDGITDKKQNKKLTQSEFWEVMKNGVLSKCKGNNSD